MRLNWIKYTNFKGLRDFSLEPQCNNLNVFGDNATCKTTTYDGFLWLITGKDSQNKTDFEIKTLTAEGEPLHNLEHEVEAELTHKGRTFTLKKVFSEKWTKKRGQAKAEFTGHETNHFIDGVPKSKKEYDAFIATIIDEKTLKILTNPLFFNDDDAMKTKDAPGWKVRRNILLEICGDISDEDVIASDRTLAGLTAILLNGRSLDDHRQVIKARQSKINEELKKIPVRIDEVSKGLSEEKQSDKIKLETDITTFKEQMKKNQAELARIESGGEIAEKQKRLTEIETELLQIRNQLRIDTDKELDVNRTQSYEAKKKLSELQDNHSRLLRNQATVNIIIEETNGKLATLREEWKQENDKQFAIEQSDTCPTCGQPLPEEQLQEAYSKALADFNLKKSANLGKINQKGKDLKAELEKHQSQLPLYESNLKQFAADIAAQEKQIEEINATTSTIQESLADIADNPEYAAKVQAKETLALEIADLKGGNQSAKDDIQKEINRLDASIMAMETILRKMEQRQQGLERITELEGQESQLAKEYEKLEGELFLTEQFVKAKVNMLEENINSKFKLARFKLFDVQINGGINECCETTFSGVPYSGGLNHAAQINVGLDIINTLSEHYGFEAPIFVDNAEAVTKLTPVKAQVIRLVVSEPDKTLRVEVA